MSYGCKAPRVISGVTVLKPERSAVRASSSHHEPSLTRTNLRIAAWRLVGARRAVPAGLGLARFWYALRRSNSDCGDGRNRHRRNCHHRRRTARRAGHCLAVAYTQPSELSPSEHARKRCRELARLHWLLQHFIDAGTCRPLADERT